MAGTLTVTAATLTVTADDQTKTYGAANPTLTHTTTGFVNGDDETDLVGTITCSTPADETSPVASYAITCSGATSTNYAISYVAGTLTVTTATLTVTANDKTKTYGAANPTLTHTTTGFVNGDNAGDLTGSITCSTPADGTSPVGAYPITCAGATSTNYAISYVDGTLTITTATLTVTADNQTKTYGAANPTLTHTTTGFVNGDDETDLTDAITCSTAADETSPVGAYPITCAGATSDELRDHLRRRHPHGDHRDPDRDCRQPDQDLRRGEPGPDARNGRVRER